MRKNIYLSESGEKNLEMVKQLMNDDSSSSTIAKALRFYLIYNDDEKRLEDAYRKAFDEDDKLKRMMTSKSLKKNRAFNGEMERVKVAHAALSGDPEFE